MSREVGRNSDDTEAGGGPPARAGRRFLYAGLGLLAVGLLLTAYNVATGRLGPAGADAPGADDRRLRERLAQFNKEAEAAEPRFEFGYTSIRLELFKRLQAEGKRAGQAELTDMLAYPVVANDVTTRVETNTPTLEPDFGSMTVRGGEEELEDFMPLYRRGQLKRSAVNVVCLVVKQVGRGRAENVVLSADRSELDGGLYFYDYLDPVRASAVWEEAPLGEAGGATEELPPAVKRLTPEQFTLGTMDTGSAVIIPLYVSNAFDRLAAPPRGKYARWELTTGVLYVPSALRYSKAGSDSATELPVKKVYNLPLIVAGER